ncbi:uncharacterized protein LOC111715449 [Eurytemora carolleeae]|uniref:uncharacterized protein LOC111715449 n=1 Tax=Eurytemora carolleeae TaxID=1294199 RepID=UPI000C7666A9|nr:uncharacterized protein LOC111715449 [Eurytemora carolleeae]|eukprot:XP_023346541.1 uncharacterized protein LOC111715449 [Eurytemora affinis]
MIDRTTLWPEAVPLSSISIEACVRAFISTWISVNSNFRQRSTVHILHLDQSLSVPGAADSDWGSHLPLVLLGLSSVPKEDTGFPISEVVYSFALTIPGEFLDTPELPSSQFVSKIEKRRCQQTTFTRSSVSGPYLVVERQRKFLCLQIGTKVDAVSLDHLKPVFSDFPVVPVAPPPRGCPPLQPAKQPPDPSSAVKKSVVFLIKPEVIPRRNHHRHARVRSSCSSGCEGVASWGYGSEYTNPICVHIFDLSGPSVSIGTNVSWTEIRP